MSKKWSQELDELGQPRFIQLTNRVDQWVRARAEQERRSMSWIVREIVADAFREATQPQQPPAPPQPLRAAK